MKFLNKNSKRIQASILYIAFKPSRHVYKFKNESMILFQSNYFIK